MGAFKAVFLNEIDKMYKKKKAIIILIISLLAIVIGQLIVYMIRSNFGIRTASAAEFSILVLSVFVNTILPLFTTLAAIDIFAGEFSHNTMKITLSRPVTRLKVYTAKVAAVGLFVFMNLIIVMILSLLAGIIFNSASFSGEGILKVAVSYIITIVPVMVFALIIVLLSNILKSGTGIFFLSILIFIVSYAAGIIFPRFSSLFITSMFNWYSLWIAESMPVLKLLREFIIMLSYGIMFFIAGYYLFEKKEL